MTALGRWLGMVAAVAAGTALLGAQGPTPDYAAIGRAVVEQMAAGKFGVVEARYGAAMAQALPAGRLANIWKQVQAQAGAYQAITAVSVVEASGFHNAVVTCQFARAHLNVMIALDGDGRMSGLHFVPAGAPAAASWSPPDYAKPSSFHEDAVTVGTAPWELPGTLTLPNGGGPFAAVVLVHGSGPEDADETIGPNKPFRDLAWGLASRGIAVLRYVKRTRQYGAQVQAAMAGFTVQQEVIDDARAAVALLAERADIDPKKIFVLGHSEGGYLAPRIARGDADIAGVISLAGNTRPLVDGALDQLHYLAGLQAQPSAAMEGQIQALEATQKQIDNPTLQASATVDFLGAAMPASYFLDLRGYQPASLAATLHRPVLVLQGGRDYQVTEKDFDGWKTALGNDREATFKFYPTLDHLFMTGGQPPSPADYAKAGHVDATVVGDIAAWVGREGAARGQ